MYAFIWFGKLGGFVLNFRAWEWEKEFEAAKKVLAVHLGGINDPVLNQRRKEHWDKLAELAGTIWNTWADPDHHESNLDSKGEFIFSDKDYEETNWMLAASLVCHLKAEFPEFKDVKELEDLLSANLIKGDVEVLRKFELVHERKTFKGKCPICEFY